jgi:hypothetical protein
MGTEALLEEFELLTLIDDFVLFFLCILLFEEIASSEAQDNLEANTGLGDLILLPTTFLAVSSDLLDSTQEQHIGPTLFIHDGKHPLHLLQLKYFSSGVEQTKF